MENKRKPRLYINKFYLDMPDIYDKGRSGQLIYADLIGSVADHGDFPNTGWFETKKVIAETLESRINSTGYNLDTSCHSIDLQIGKEFERYYFDNLGDRIIFRLSDPALKSSLKEYLSRYFRHVDLVGDNQLLQLQPILIDSYILQYHQKSGTFKVIFSPKYQQYSDIRSFEWITVARDLGLSQCSDFTRMISAKFKWFSDQANNTPPPANEIVRSFFKSPLNLTPDNTLILTINH